MSSDSGPQIDLDALADFAGAGVTSAEAAEAINVLAGHAMKAKHPVDSDALAIARWCWPDAPHEFAPNRYDPVPHFHGVRVAERVLIERGHAHDYGTRLAMELGLLPSDIDMSAGSVRRHEHGLSLGLDQVAAIATAPLDARVRALAAVIRGLAKD